MRTVTFQSVRNGVATRTGIDPENLQQDEFAAIVEYINDHLRQGVEAFGWPELNPVEKRTFREPYRADRTYGTDEEVYYEDAYYVATAETTGNLPTDTDFWAEIEELDAYIALDQSWEENAISEVAEVYEADPRKTDSSRTVRWWLSDRGIEFFSSVPNHVFVKFALRTPQFTSEGWNANRSYEAEALVYVSAAGECFRALRSSTGAPPATSPDEWERVKFPYVLSVYTKNAAAAELLDEDEKPETADRYRGKATDAFNNELAKVTIRQGQTATYGVKTR